MDIAKIRKKAKERELEKKAADEPLSPPPETAAEEVGEEAVVETAATGGYSPSDNEEAVEAGEAPEESFPCALPSPTDEKSGTAEEPAKDGGQAAGEAEGGDRILELLTFSLSKEEFAFKVSEVEEIVRYQPVTAVPMMPDYVLGITSLRGKIIPVMDLKKRIVFRGRRAGSDEVDPGSADRNAKILILLGPKGLIGVTIDRVLGVVRFPHDRVLAPPSHLTEEETRFVDGIVVLDKRFVSIVRSEEALNIEVT